LIGETLDFKISLAHRLYFLVNNVHFFIDPLGMKNLLNYFLQLGFTFTIFSCIFRVTSALFHPVYVNIVADLFY